MRKPCTNCTVSRAYAKGLCLHCYNWSQGHDTPRPTRLIARQRQRELFGHLPIDERIDMARTRALFYQRSERAAA